MKGRRKTRLSIKIILMLFVILAAVFGLLHLIITIVRAAGGELIRNPQDAEVRLFILVPLFIGTGIVIAFAYAINLTVVARIKKLKDATGEVAKGNLDIGLEVEGTDELSELTESFNKMSAELKANEYLSKDFVRNISHEFKTPISAIRAYGELIEAEAKDPALKEYADVIIKESDRLAVLSKSILQLSLLDSTTIVKKDDVFNPAEQIRDIFRLTQAKWSEKNMDLDLDLEELTVTNNSQLLYQVWQNLISNAIKFGNKKIKAVLKQNGNGILFEIADDGVGIKDCDKEKIFDHFFMADSSRNTEGSGLGLAIIKKILAKLGGEITFESTEGKGATFRVRLLTV